jgi:hypothetical protein
VTRPAARANANRKGAAWRIGGGLRRRCGRRAIIPGGEAVQPAGAARDFGGRHLDLDAHRHAALGPVEDRRQAQHLRLVGQGGERLGRHLAHLAGQDLADVALLHIDLDLQVAQVGQVAQGGGEVEGQRVEHAAGLGLLAQHGAVDGGDDARGVEAPAGALDVGLGGPHLLPSQGHLFRPRPALRLGQRRPLALHAAASRLHIGLRLERHRLLHRPFLDGLLDAAEPRLGHLQAGLGLLGRRLRPLDLLLARPALQEGKPCLRHLQHRLGPGQLGPVRPVVELAQHLALLDLLPLLDVALDQHAADGRRHLHRARRHDVALGLQHGVGMRRARQPQRHQPHDRRSHGCPSGA